MILRGFISIRLSVGARAFYIRARVRAPGTAGDVLTVCARTCDPRRRAPHVACDYTILAWVHYTGSKDHH